MGSMISGLLGGGESAGQEAQMAALREAQGNIQAYRPEAMQARLNALSNMSTAYQGANNALETMYGGGQKMGPVGMGKLGGGGFQTKPSEKFMGHDLPSQAAAMGAVGGPGSPQQGRPQIGQGNGWEDTAAMVVDPLGIFRGMF
jgi:hypothetical protein